MKQHYTAIFVVMIIAGALSWATWGGTFPPPPPQGTLSVVAQGYDGDVWVTINVQVTVDGIGVADTPCNFSDLPVGTYNVTVPSSSGEYDFHMWEDTSISPSRTVTLASSTKIITAFYHGPVKPPPIPPGVHVHPNIVDSSIAKWWSGAKDWGAIQVLRKPTGEIKKYDGKYWAVYTTTTGMIGIMSSEDLQSWEDSPSNPIFTMADVGGWERSGLASCDFLYMNEFYRFWLFYSASGADGAKHVGVAYSNSLTSFSSDLSQPIFSCGEGGGAENFHVQQMTNGDWVGCFEIEVPPTSGMRIGLAKTSTHLPNTGWFFVCRPFTNMAPGSTREVNPGLIRYGDDFYMHYEDYHSNDINMGLMYCHEDDFFVQDSGWTRWIDNPVYDLGVDLAPDHDCGWIGNRVYVMAKHLPAPGTIDLLYGGIDSGTGEIYVGFE